LYEPNRTRYVLAPSAPELTIDTPLNPLLFSVRRIRFASDSSLVARTCTLYERAGFASSTGLVFLGSAATVALGFGGSSTSITRGSAVRLLAAACGTLPDSSATDVCGAVGSFPVAPSGATLEGCGADCICCADAPCVLASSEDAAVDGA
jgi:hypothetical protein